MGLAAKRVIEFQGPVVEKSGLAGQSITLYKGAIVVYSAGYLELPTDAAAKQVAGIYNGLSDAGRDDALVIGAGAHPRVEIESGWAWLPFSGAAQTDVGVLFYVADDTTVTKTAGSKTIMYRAEDFKAGYLLFNLLCPVPA
jgi:hypothetical protein